MQIKSKVRSGGVQIQHVQRKLVVKSKVRSGIGRDGDSLNRNARKLVVKSKVQAGSISTSPGIHEPTPGSNLNHNARKLVVKTKTHAGLNGGGGWDANRNARKV